MAGMYQLKVQVEPPAQSGSDMSAQELKELLWSGGECNVALIRDGAFRQKKLVRQLVKGGACKEQLMAGEQQPQLFQSGLEEKLAFQPEAEGTERRPKRLVRGPQEAYRVMDGALQCAGELMVGKEESGAERWQLPGEPDEEEIYWGCFYFFPWLRMWRKGKRLQP